MDKNASCLFAMGHLHLSLTFGLSVNERVA